MRRDRRRPEGACLLVTNIMVRAGVQVRAVVKLGLYAHLSASNTVTTENTHVRCA